MPQGPVEGVDCAYNKDPLVAMWWDATPALGAHTGIDNA